VLPGRQRRPDPVGHQKNGGPWQHLIERMLQGRCEIFQGTGPYRPWMTVDVRDDAACHAGLLESDRVGNGERYIAWSTDRRSYEDVVATIDRVLPELRHDPGPIADNTPDRHQAREQEFRSIWNGLELRNDRIRSVVPITFRPLDDSIRDCVESLISVAGVEVSRRAS
jgi:hypothetical protein